MLYLLDSSAILNDFGFSLDGKDNYLITPLIAKEFKDLRSRMLMDAALQRGILQILEPTKASLEKVKAKASELGMNCSEADISIIALALDKKEKHRLKLITDDYSIQNICLSLRIPFKAVIQGRVKRQISIPKKCPNCNNKLPNFQSRKFCSYCDAVVD